MTLMVPYDGNLELAVCVSRILFVFSPVPESLKL